MKFVIIAGALTGNRGSEAMVVTCVQQVRRNFPEANICLATYHPADDSKELKKLFPGSKKLFIYSCTPKNLVLSWLPLSLLSKLLPILKKGSVRPLGSIRDLLDADVVLDVAGISFIDGREKFLPFNVLTLLPFTLHRAKVYKMSQALGPITSSANRICARLILPNLAMVYARGATTHRFLQESGIRMNVKTAPDVSFSMDSGQYTPYDKRPERSVAIVPSSLIMRKNSSYVDNMAAFMALLIKADLQVSLVVHSWLPGNKTRNNDIPAAEAINSKLAKPVRIVGKGMNSSRLREELSTYRVVVSSRFHGMIAALETSTPVLVIGWSHKYREVLQDFDLGEAWCISYEKINSERLALKTRKILEQGSVLSKQLDQHLGNVKSLSTAQFTAVFDSLTRSPI